MDIKNIKAIAEIVNQNGLTKLEVCEGETRITIEKAAAPVFAAPQKPQETAQMKASTSENPSEPQNDTLDFNNIVEVKSPIVGIFYASPSPEASPFVTIGKKVKKGDVLCIIEAMKLMNEITAECDGEIADICVKNGDIIEFGQVLFKMF